MDLPSSGMSAAALGALYELGLLLLMFAAGTEMRRLLQRNAARTVSVVAGFGMAVAVTSIPVISRIMHDLDLLSTRFARMVLSAAVVEDIVLYVVLAIAVGLVQTSHSTVFGLPTALSIHTIPQNAVYHTIVALIFLGLALGFGGRAYNALTSMRANVLVRRSPVGFQLLWMLALSAAALALGLVPLYGAFTAGIAVAVADDSLAGRPERNALTGISFGFFIPIYFALIGIQLDLIHHFNVVFFAGFLLFACIAKAASVYLGARLSRENQFMSLSLAIGMNARGGPGIVLASTAYAAGIINETFFGSLVMLSVVTSLLAGSVLERIAPRLGAPARPHEQASEAVPGELGAAGRSWDVGITSMTS